LIKSSGKYDNNTDDTLEYNGIGRHLVFRVNLSGKVKEMTVTGEVAEGYNSYIIRGKTPSTMVWTILNPEPKILNEYIKSGKIVEIDLHIVSGDNINIKKIDGKEYP